MERIRQPKKLIKIELIIIDIFLLLLTYFIGAQIYETTYGALEPRSFGIYTVVLVSISIGIFYIFGIYNMLLKHLGFQEILRIIAAIVLKNLIFMFFFAIFQSYFEFIRYIGYFVITPLEIFLIVIPRTLPRLFRYLDTLINRKKIGSKTLIIGAGSGGYLVLNEIINNKSRNNYIIGFVDDDTNKIGSKMGGVKIYGPIKNIKEIIKQMGAEEVIIAIKGLKAKSLSGIVKEITDVDVSVKKMHILSEVSSEKPVTLVDVKVEDLLNREPVRLDNQDLYQLLENQVILVTGGGGSIGSELCRQIINYRPKKLVILDIYENTTYEIQMELLRHFNKYPESKVDLEVIIGSVYNFERMEWIFKTHTPNIVFHAAAYKHVPLMEDSPVEAVRTNIIGTYYVASLAGKYKADKFVLVSTDKAVRPTSVMGSCKRYAEHIIQDQDEHTPHTKYSAVRFGNVLGSNGSVIPLFKKQIEDGGPVTVTHKDITRYFMTIPEAVSLILESGTYAEGGEIFVLDMGEPVKIYDLAERMIRLAGYQPHKDIDIEVVGLRPGEKLFEEILIDTNNEKQKKTGNAKIFIEHETPLTKEELKIEYLIENIQTLSNEEASQFIKEIIPTYHGESGQIEKN